MGKCVTWSGNWRRDTEREREREIDLRRLEAIVLTIKQQCHNFSIALTL